MRWLSTVRGALGLSACVISPDPVIDSGGGDMTRRSTIGLLACLLATGAVLGGCSEAQKANDTLPSTSAATPTEEELPPLGPADLPVPAEAREKTPEGAVEFVRYYVTLTKHVSENSQDSEPLLQLSEDCRTCIRIAQSIEADRAANYTYREYVFRFEEYGPALVAGDTAQVGFLYVQGPITVLDQAGQVVTDRSAAKAQELQSGAVLLWRQDLESWVVTGLTVG
jgi:hypothetical protein